MLDDEPAILYSIVMIICRQLLRSGFLVATILAFAHCAEERPEEIPQKFERGIKGEGTVYEPTREDDPFINQNARSGR